MLKIQKLEMEIHSLTLKVLLVPAIMEHRDQNYSPYKKKKKTTTPRKLDKGREGRKGKKHSFHQMVLTPVSHHKQKLI